MVVPKKIIRSTRKSVALLIDSTGDLIVRAPIKMSNAQINEFIVKKDAWIRKKQQQIQASDEKYDPIAIVEDGSILYLGKNYMINIKYTNTISVDERNICLPSDEPKSALISWLKEQGLIIINERVSFYSLIMGVQYANVKLSEAKTRWGSCSAKSNLNFAWRLIMCPIEVIDYVVVHELSHIVYMNHSAIFWSRVATILPNYKEQREWLKKSRKLMNII